ncbi:MAG: HAMP domain-containing histidine kinase, partial [Desulfobacterales bacterium]|nr:HAMP domain-containing histidine kinase [Desulfobacterales bacterium]
RLTRKLPVNVKVADAAGISLDALDAYMKRRGILGYLDNICTAGTRAAKIIDNMLSFSRKSDRSKRRCNVVSLIENSLELAVNDYDLKKTYDFKRIDIIREFYAEDLEINCEESKIQQALFNMLKNAAQAMKTGDDKAFQPKIILRLFRSSDQGDRACIEVEDNGPGMDTQTREKIFEPFFTTKEVGLGTGLGLSVTYFIIVDDHSGEMEVESAAGQGCKFIIRLPLE